MQVVRYAAREPADPARLRRKGPSRGRDGSLVCRVQSGDPISGQPAGGQRDRMPRERPASGRPASVAARDLRVRPPAPAVRPARPATLGNVTPPRKALSDELRVVLALLDPNPPPDDILNDVELFGGSLVGMNLRRVKLVGRDLMGADLRNAHLQGADLRNAQLQGADLRRTKLQGATLQGAQMVGADLRGADLSGATYASDASNGEDGRFEPPNLSATKWNCSTRWPNRLPPAVGNLPALTCDVECPKYTKRRTTSVSAPGYVCGPP